MCLASLFRSACRCVASLLGCLCASLALALSASAQAVDENIVDPGSQGIIVKAAPVVVPHDTVMMQDGKLKRFIRSIHVDQVEGRSPATATMYAAVLPGLGQVYNHRYWKVPILYAGAGALVYSIHFNNKYYKKYSSAYRDFLIQDPNNKSYLYFVKKAHLTEEEVMNTYSSWFQTALRNKKNYYRRYRDLSIFGMVGLYVVQIVDACVDAHFFNFDVSDDLSMRWMPSFSPENGCSAGATVCINF